MAIQLGDTAPDFTAETTEGKVRLHEWISLLPRPAQVHCVALNTHHQDENAACRAIAEAEDATGLPADDPVRFGAAKLVDALEPVLHR